MQGLLSSYADAAYLEEVLGFKFHLLRRIEFGRVFLTANPELRGIGQKLKKQKLIYFGDLLNVTEEQLRGDFQLPELFIELVKERFGYFGYIIGNGTPAWPPKDVEALRQHFNVTNKALETRSFGLPTFNEPDGGTKRAAFYLKIGLFMPIDYDCLPPRLVKFLMANAFEYDGDLACAQSLLFRSRPKGIGRKAIVDIERYLSRKHLRTGLPLTSWRNRLAQN